MAALRDDRKQPHQCKSTLKSLKQVKLMNLVTVNYLQRNLKVEVEIQLLTLMNSLMILKLTSSTQSLVA